MGKKRLLIRGARVVDPANVVDRMADILIEEGEISKIESPKPRAQILEDIEVIEAQGKIVLPGLIDMHVHLRQPGGEDKETILSGCEAAAAGGFTAMACMPNTHPPVDTPKLVKWIISQAEEAKARVYPIAAITEGRRGEALSDMARLLEAGAVAFSDDGDPVGNPQLMLSALRVAKQLDALIISHAEEKALTQGGQMNEGRVSRALGLKGIPAVAEYVGVARDIALAEYVGAKLHIAHLSTAGAVELVRQAKRRGAKITAETAPHYFTLTEEQVKVSGTNAKMNPPLRTLEDVEAIKEGLADGTIDVIASDHAPHTVHEKALPFCQAPFGIIGLETTLGLVLTHLVAPRVISLSEAAALMSTNPARILGIRGGEIKAGDKANLTIIDPELEWKVEVGQFRSKSRNSPFQGWRLKGKAIMTIVEGKLWLPNPPE